MSRPDSGFDRCGCETLVEVIVELKSDEPAVCACIKCGGRLSLERVRELWPEPTLGERFESLSKAFRALGRTARKALRG